MKLPNKLFGALFLGAVAFLPTRLDAAAVLLPASTALPTNSVSNPGFEVRVAQASTNQVVANNARRAQQQINATLRDAGNNIVTNIAIAGTNANGSFAVDTVSFEKDGNQVFPIMADGNVMWALVSTLFPGVPGLEDTTTQFATESVALVHLEAGTHQLAISSAADRTDVNDDDGYVLFVGQNPRDFFSTRVAEFHRGGAASFTSNQHVENEVTVIAPVAGVYPFRILHWQQGRGSSLHFYRIDTNSTVRTLINDPWDMTAQRAYRSSTVARFNAPYISEISPAPGSAGNSFAAPIQIVLFDGPGSTVNTGTIQMRLNGTAVTPTTVKAGSKTTVTFNPDAGRANPNNLVTFLYTDSLGVVSSNQWSFTIVTAGGSASSLAGQWDFDFGDLRATHGAPLAFLDPSFDGPAGSAPDKTSFGTCASFGIPLINGQEAVVMRVPGGLDRRYGIVLNHGIAPNGGGTRVNQYTLIMDIMVDTSGAWAASMLQVDSTGNLNDGDLFWQQGNFGQGTDGYNGKGTFTPGVWHRVIAAYDMAANPPVVTKYVDGVKQDDWTANQGLDAARRALLPTALLFADGDQDERRTMWVNSIQIRAGKLSDAEMAALGGPDAGGIPTTMPVSTVSGQWDFEYGDLSATVGKPLAYVDPGYDGPTGTNANKTAFGTCSALGVALVNGADAKVMEIPGDLTRSIGYVMNHGIAPNGGGSRVNQYTLIMDVMVDASGAWAASMLQVDSTNNAAGNDGDLFWQQGNFGQGTDGYNGKGTFTPGAWHRVIAAYDMAANPPVVTKYVDGIKQDDWTANQSLDAPRRALLPLAVLFGDGDQDERRKMWVSSIQIRAGKLSDAHCALLGGPSAAGIPVALPGSNVSGQWDFNEGNLAATVGKALQYVDPTYDGPTGTAGTKTAFGTCTTLGVATVGGSEELVAQIPGDLTRSLGYVMDHGIAPNGGGSRVNQYTLVMDVFVNATGAWAASLLQVDSPANALGNDGDLFWQQGNFGQGTGGYNGPGTFTAGAWHRVAAAYNMAANPPVVTKYVDGIFQDDWTANQGLDAPRRALLPTAVLFADGDQDERRMMWVNSIQIRSGALSKPELAALGSAAPGGIPLSVTLPPAIRLGKVGNQMVLTWPLSYTGYALESSTDLVNWSVVPGVANNSTVVTIQPTGGQFYRLKR